ncbi:Fungal specific transcription factor domain-containing protein [Operophtera brumata]|uniref:Fungal specific transcription factor domain-containing protein n=1 Tax=Operophtera brumata TaxID=104452 RepID=A0A0L7LMQ5_OPEBR|nr:Fungal specific transcription factor domain-containing protein [Operophtera brumata]
MMCLPLAVLLLAQVTHPLRTAHVTSPPSLVDRLDELYKKLERLTVEPNLISPTPNPLSDEDEELLSAMQTWGNLTPDQLNEVVKDMLMREDVEDDRTERLSDLEYADMMADDNEEVSELL